MKLLFHCCCAPCAASCIDTLTAEGIAPRLFWYNPNIHPCAEYKNRRDSLVQFAAAGQLELEQVDAYGLRIFLHGVFPHSVDAPQRCSFCYRLRLEKTAACAAQNGFDAFSTSLLASPYQRHDEIRSTAEECAAQHGVAFLYRDFRPHFRAGQNAARAQGLYMQKYCGCIFSEEDRYSGAG
jgi:predicted adenine nucleotide alpha hydrolase (AANH) superfamily ATPase